MGKSAMPPGRPSPDTLSARFSTAIVLFHAGVAEAVGLNLTDYKCLELLLRRGITNPGQLSAEAGLSSATTTLVLDRLEKRGLLKRQQDPADRRKVVLKVALTPELTQRFQVATKEMMAGMGALMVSFTPAERGVIDRYLTAAAEVLEGSLRNLKTK